MSFSETIFLFFLALVIFGPKKLPEIARQVGKALNEFRRASNEFKAQIEQEIAHLERENTQTILPPSYPPAGTASRSLDSATLDQPEPSATLAAPSGTAADSANAAESGVRATEAVSAEEPVTTSSSQESHA
jgi:TatA/E family protein of Tat protein translocase